MGIKRGPILKHSRAQRRCQKGDISNNKSPPARHSFKSLSTILHTRYYRWTTPCIWRGFLYLSGITRIRRHEGERSTGWPRFHYKITFLVLGHALFPFSVSRLVSSCDPKYIFDRPKLDRAEKTRSRVSSTLAFFTTRASRVAKIAHRHVSSCFQGAQGEPGTKGERGDPGLPVSPTLHQVFIHRIWFV